MKFFTKVNNKQQNFCGKTQTTACALDSAGRGGQTIQQFTKHLKTIEILDEMLACFYLEQIPPNTAEHYRSMLNEMSDRSTRNFKTGK